MRKLIIMISIFNWSSTMANTCFDMIEFESQSNRCKIEGFKKYSYSRTYLDTYQTYKTTFEFGAHENLAYTNSGDTIKYNVNSNQDTISCISDENLEWFTTASGNYESHLRKCSKSNNSYTCITSESNSISYHYVDKSDTVIFHGDQYKCLDTNTACNCTGTDTPRNTIHFNANDNTYILNKLYNIMEGDSIFRLDSIVYEKFGSSKILPQLKHNYPEPKHQKISVINALGETVFHGNYEEYLQFSRHKDDFKVKPLYLK